MNVRIGSVITLVGLALAPTALGGAAEDKLGEAYAKASPAEKVAQLSVAQTDKVLESKETRPALEEVVRAVLAGGATPKDRLELLGKLRADSKALVDPMNEGRKKEKKQFISLLDPETDTQLAVSLDYITSVCGDKPTLQELECLKLVRDSTSWGSTGKLVLAFMQEALDRDQAFAAADLEGKLRMIQTMAIDKQMMSDFERTPIESALLAEHCAASLAAGQAVADVRGRVKAWADKKLICFFTKSFIDGMLARLEEHRAGRKQ
jgi:hypothetical protein